MSVQYGYTILAVAASGLIALLCPALASADTPDGLGNNTTETRSTGTPDNPKGFGSVTSQRAIEDRDIGQHVSQQPVPHFGVGNVAADDGVLATVAGVTDTGSRPSDHALIIGKLSGYDPFNRPGTHE